MERRCGWHDCRFNKDGACAQKDGGGAPYRGSWGRLRHQRLPEEVRKYCRCCRPDLGQFRDNGGEEELGRIALLICGRDGGCGFGGGCPRKGGHGGGCPLMQYPVPEGAPEGGGACGTPDREVLLLLCGACLYSPESTGGDGACGACPVRAALAAL